MEILEKVISQEEKQARKVAFGRAMQKRLQNQIGKVQNDPVFEHLIEKLIS